MRVNSGEHFWHGHVQQCISTRADECQGALKGIYKVPVVSFRVSGTCFAEKLQKREVLSCSHITHHRKT